MNALLVESHPLLRLGLLQMLERIEGIDQVVTVDPADLSHLDSHYADTDLLIFGMPTDAEAGWQWLAEARRVVAAQRVLLLSEVVPIQIPAEVMAQGVCGCLPKSASLAVLEAAIRLAIVGGYFVRGNHAPQLPTFPSSLSAAHPTVTGGPGGAAPAASLCRAATLSPVAPLQHPAGIPAARAVVAPLHAIPPVSARVPVAETAGDSPRYDEAEMLQITPRQYEVLVLLARGHPIKTVSRMLNISVATVKSHACTLYQRLKVRNKGEAVYTALQRGATLEWVSGDGTTPHAPVTRLQRPTQERAERPAAVQASATLR